MSKTATSPAAAAAAVHAAAAKSTPAPVSTFGDDGTRAAYYASMATKSPADYATAVLPLLSPEQISEVSQIVAKWAREAAEDKAISRLARLVRKGKSADKAFRLLANVATFAHDTANLTFVGHGRYGFTLLADVPAVEGRGAGTVKVTFTPAMLTGDNGLPTPNVGHDRPESSESDSE